jgi:hypothetical protein
MDPHDPRGKNVSTPGAPDSEQWQRLWFATRQKAWNSLAIIPSDRSIEAGTIAKALVATGQVHGERPVTLLNACGVQLNGVHQLVDTLGTMTGRGDWVIVPVDPIADNPTAVPIVQATSGALLVVRLGESLLGSARTAIEAVGRDRFLGSIVLGGREGASSLHFALPALIASVCVSLFTT